MIHVLAMITAKPGMRERILEAYRGNVANVRAEAGCLAYEAVVDVPGMPSVFAQFGADTFVVVERWESVEALARPRGRAAHEGVREPGRALHREPRDPRAAGGVTMNGRRPASSTGTSMKISIPSLARGAAASSLVALAACGGFGSDSIIGGTLSGLATGATVVLSDNGADNLTLAANGSFVFATKVAASGAYSVAVVTQPTGQTCSVANATGKVNNAGSDINNIDVACVTTSSVVVTVTGLAPPTRP